MLLATGTVLHRILEKYQIYLQKKKHNDSATSGFSLKGYKNSTSVASDLMAAILEYRGLSYGIGGDENALTVANYIRNYQPGLQGSSIGQRITGVCNGKL